MSKLNCRVITLDQGIYVVSDRLRTLVDGAFVIDSEGKLFVIYDYSYRGVDHDENTPTGQVFRIEGSSDPRVRGLKLTEEFMKFAKSRFLEFVQVGVNNKTGRPKSNKKGKLMVKSLD